MTEETEKARIVTERALDLYRHTSSSIAAHLEQVDAWLRVAALPGEPDFWRVDAVAGPIGALADAWGRLTLWARSNGTEPQVAGDLEEIMDGLAELHARLLSGDAGSDEPDRIRRLRQRAQHVYQVSVLDRQPQEMS